MLKIARSTLAATFVLCLAASAPASAQTPSLSIGDDIVFEGDAGTTTATVTITLSQAAAAPVTVDFATADDSATAGQDYVARANTATFAPGVTSVPLDITVNGDTAIEDDETFFVNLSNASANATIQDGSGLVAILADDFPSLSVDDASIAEGNSGSSNLTFTVSLSAPAPFPVTVDFATANGTATAGQDYTARTNDITFAPGVTSLPITIPISGDTTAELNETFTLNLSNAINATISDPQGVGTITNDDIPTLSISDDIVSEGDAGTTTATVTITLSQASPAPVTVDFDTADDSATAGEDYVARANTATFAPGITSVPLDITVNGDTAIEDDEVFFVDLSNASANATISQDDAGLVAILADDFPSLSVNDVSIAEGNSGSSNLTFTVSLSAPAPFPVTVDFATANGTATAGQDYTARTNDLTFAPGDTSRPVTIAISGDTVTEPNETFIITLSSAGNASISDATGTGTITNDDVSPPPAKPAAGIEVADIVVLENAGLATFTVRVHDASDKTVTANYATVDGTAKAPGDYRTTTGSLSFAPGEAQKVVTIVMANDAFGEPTEVFGLVLSSVAPTDVVLVKPAAIAQIVNDDPSCVVPKVTGMTRALAKATLVRAGCRLGKTIRRYSSRRKNRVFKQSPPAGLEVFGGHKATIVVSKGKRPKKKR